MNVKVSILIPCYNAERWIAQAIESALNQTYPHTEVIVVDDGSTDGSLEIIKSFGDRLYWETGKNRGGNHARNRLLELSTGEWIQYLDSDDYLLPQKVEKQITFSQTTEADIIFSPVILEYIEDNIENARQEVLSIPEPHDIPILLARWYLPQTGSPLWRKQAILDVGKWKVDQPCCQEHELYLRLLIAGKKFQYYPETGAVYRQWSESTLCKRDKPEIFRQRLHIENTLEAYLTKNNELNIERQFAINQARFECARLIWSFDPQWANLIIKKIQTSNFKFTPSGHSAPILYRLMYQLLGFDNAEKIAQFRRRLLNKFSVMLSNE